MILSASRRTDIPAFFSDWFYKRIEEGFISNLKRLDNLGYKYYFQFTITFYDQNIEKNVAV
ncbi:MAG: DUF1848 family protein [Treponema sp.]